MKEASLPRRFAPPHRSCHAGHGSVAEVSTSKCTGRIGAPPPATVDGAGPAGNEQGVCLVLGNWFWTHPMTALASLSASVLSCHGMLLQYLLQQVVSPALRSCFESPRLRETPFL